MLKKFYLCVMFMSISLYVSTSAATTDLGNGCYTVEIETGKLRVRECAGAECEVIGGLNYGAPICPTQIIGDWAEFQYNYSDRKGYVSISYLKACPNTTGPPKTVEATFLEASCGDFCYATFRLADGEEITLVRDYDEIGLKEGTKVSITYQEEQWWNAATDGAGGWCWQADMLQSVEILPNN